LVIVASISYLNSHEIIPNIDEACNSPRLDEIQAEKARKVIVL